MLSHLLRSIALGPGKSTFSSLFVRTSQAPTLFSRCFSKAQLTAQLSSNNQNSILIHSTSLINPNNILFREKFLTIPNRFTQNSSKPLPNEKENVPSPTIMQRFKNAYKQYGILLICVHVVTSLIWFSGFYILVKFGVDISSVIAKLGYTLDKFKSTDQSFTINNLPEFGVAVVLHKIMAPVRYTSTIFISSLFGRNPRIMKFMRRINVKLKLSEETPTKRSDSK